MLLTVYIVNQKGVTQVGDKYQYPAEAIRSINYAEAAGYSTIVVDQFGRLASVEGE